MSEALAFGRERPVKVEEPALRGDPIGAERYVSADYFRREWRHMWMRTWQIGGVSYQASKSGDYLLTELGPESILLVRQQDLSMKGFFNVCPHRGTRIMAGDEGHAERFTCPYHGWQFDHAGVLVAAPNADDFPQGNPCGHLRMKPVQVEELFGFIWFNMDLEAPSLSESLGPNVVEEIGSYRMEKMVRVLNMSTQADCNWKIITDNFNEAYHVQVLHPELIPYIESQADICQFDLLSGGHNRGWFPAHQPSTLYEGESVPEPLASMVREWNIDPEQWQGVERFEQLRREVQKQKRELGAERGFVHYEHLKDYQLTDYIIYNLFPNSVITVGPDGVQLLRPRPHESDPQKCYFDHWWLVPEIEGRTMTPSPAGGPDLPVVDAEHEFVEYGTKTLGTTTDQDLSIAAVQQKGLNSVGFDHFHLAHQERRVQRFHEVLNDYLAQGDVVRSNP
jgi:phenylpropionate dioxygenase-like ring-hydroxylating dioxygenase large terminal subunit